MFKIKIHNLKSNQSGVVLIMSLMILVVMIISVVALSRVIVGEVKMTRNADNSIIAFYAAEIGIEKALYYLKLGRQATDFSDFNALENDEIFIDNERSFLYNQATTTGQSFITYDISTSSPATAQIILADGAIPGGTPSPYLADNYTIDWSIDNCLTDDHASDRLEVSATSLYKEGGVLKSDTRQNTYVCGCNSSTDDSCDPINESYVDDDKFYYFTFRPLNDTVSLLEFIPDNGGNPVYPGEANIEVAGAYRQSAHTISVKVNTLAPASGIFSYVIFSDDELSKNF